MAAPNNENVKDLAELLALLHELREARHDRERCEQEWRAELNKEQAADRKRRRKEAALTIGTCEPGEPDPDNPIEQLMARLEADARQEGFELVKKAFGAEKPTDQ